MQWQAHEYDRPRSMGMTTSYIPLVSSQHRAEESLCHHVDISNPVCDRKVPCPVRPAQSFTKGQQCVGKPWHHRHRITSGIHLLMPNASRRSANCANWLVAWPAYVHQHCAANVLRAKAADCQIEPALLLAILPHNRHFPRSCPSYRTVVAPPGSAPVVTPGSNHDFATMTSVLVLLPCIYTRIIPSPLHASSLSYIDDHRLLRRRSGQLSRRVDHKYIVVRRLPASRLDTCCTDSSTESGSAPIQRPVISPATMETPSFALPLSGISRPLFLLRCTLGRLHAEDENLA